MSDETNIAPPEQQLVSKNEAKTTDLAPLVPLVEKWIDSQSESAHLDHEIKKEELSVLRQANSYSFRLLIIIIIVIFALAAGLIFLKDKLDAGLLVLSHVGAIVAGLLAGMGFERARRSIDE